jgi:hypothetical protein
MEDLDFILFERFYKKGDGDVLLYLDDICRAKGDRWKIVDWITRERINPEKYVQPLNKVFLTAARSGNVGCIEILLMRCDISGDSIDTAFRISQMKGDKNMENALLMDMKGFKWLHRDRFRIWLDKYGDLIKDIDDENLEKIYTICKAFKSYFVKFGAIPDMIRYFANSTGDMLTCFQLILSLS